MPNLVMEMVVDYVPYLEIDIEDTLEIKLIPVIN